MISMRKDEDRSRERLALAKIVNLFLFAVHGVIMLMTVTVWEVYGIFVGGLWEAECDA